MPRSTISFDDFRVDDQYEFQGTIVVDWEIDNTYFVITDLFVEDGYFITSGTPKLMAKLEDRLQANYADLIAENEDE